MGEAQSNHTVPKVHSILTSILCRYEFGAGKLKFRISITSMKTASYGTWESPITADLLSAGETPLLEVKVYVSSSSSRITAKT